MRNGKSGELEFIVADVPLYGECGAGSVVQFVPREGSLSVAIPHAMRESEIGSVIVRGCSLEDEGIYDGDILIFNKRFTRRECMFETICIVFILATGELVAKKLLFAGDGMITLRASGGDIKDMVFQGEDIEIRGVVFGFQRMIQKQGKKAP